MLLIPIALGLLAGLAGTIFHLPAAASNPTFLTLLVIFLIGSVALPFVRGSMTRRASIEAGTYLNSMAYTGRDRLPMGVVSLKPSVLENYLFAYGIPLHGQPSPARFAIPREHLPAGRGLLLVARALKSMASPAQWVAVVAGFAMTIAGTLIAIALAVAIFVELLAGHVDPANLVPGVGVPQVFLSAGILIFGGAGLSGSAIRRIRQRSEQRRV